MAANDQWLVKGTTQLFNNGGSEDVAFSMQGVADGAGRVSAQKDWTAGARPSEYEWFGELQLQATPTINGTVDFYAAAGQDGTPTRVWGNVGQADAALADVNIARNLLYIGSITVESATANKKFINGGTFTFTPRYMTIVGINNAGSAIHATAANFLFYVQPYNYQVQS